MGPHVGLHVALGMVPTKTMVRKLVEPLPLPILNFWEIGKYENYVKSVVTFVCS